MCNKGAHGVLFFEIINGLGNDHYLGHHYRPPCAFGSFAVLAPYHSVLEVNVHVLGVLRLIAHFSSLNATRCDMML